MNILIISFIIFFSFCVETFKKLSGTIIVSPYTYVYFDAKKYKVGEKLNFKFRIPEERFDYYSFKIGQSSSNDYTNLEEWDYLHEVKVKCGAREGFECFYEWTETKSENTTYIFIIPLKPSPELSSNIEISFTNGTTLAVIILIILAAIIFGIGGFSGYRQKEKGNYVSYNYSRKERNNTTEEQDDNYNTTDY